MAPATDLRLSTKIKLTTPDAAGVAFRWQSPDQHQRLILDSRSGTAQLLHVDAKTPSVVWSGAAVLTLGDWQDLGWRPSAGAFGRGSAATCCWTPLLPQMSPAGSGCSACASGGTSFAAVRVEAADPAWMPYATLHDEVTLAAGRRVRIFAGRVEDVTVAAVTAEVRRFLGRVATDAAATRLPDYGVDLRLLRPDGTTAQARRMAPDSAFSDEAVQMARSADGTGLALVRPDSTAGGRDIRRKVASTVCAGRSDETTRLRIPPPWSCGRMGTPRPRASGWISGFLPLRYVPHAARDPPQPPMGGPTGEWPNGKAPDSGSGDSRFESLLASQARPGALA